MLGKPHILSLFPNSFNKFNITMSTHVRSSVYETFASDSLFLALYFYCSNITFLGNGHGKV